MKIRNDAGGKGHYGASRSGGRRHRGLDLEAPLGSPVLAAKSGRILFSGPKGNYGNLIEILHPEGRQSRYAHLSHTFVETGDWVGRGHRIGSIGKTGNARNSQIHPHLHFEIRKAKQALNPTALLNTQGGSHEHP